MTDNLKLLKVEFLQNLESSVLIPFSHKVRAFFSPYVTALEKENQELEERLAEQQKLAQRTIFILKEANFFECDKDGFSPSGLHRDLLKVANGVELKDIINLHKLTITALELQLAHMHSKAKIFTVWAGGTEVVDYYVDYDTAIATKKYYEDQGYDDVVIDAKGLK